MRVGRRWASGCSEKAYVIRRSYRAGHTKHEAVAEATIEYISMNVVLYLAYVCEFYVAKPIGTRAVPQFTTGVAKPLTQIELGETEHHPPV